MPERKLSNNEFAHRFDKVAERYDSISNSYTRSRRYQNMEEVALGSCLEIGAGTGYNLYQERKEIYVLSDISPHMCEIAKKRTSKVVCCDAEKLPFSDKSFDTIILSEVIYYLNNPEHFLQEAHRVLKENGKLLISTADQDTNFYDKGRAVLRLLGFKHMYFDDGAHSFMRLSHLRKLLKEKNFVVRKVKKFVFFPFRQLHWLNKIIERTSLQHFCIFIFVIAEKK